MGKTLAIIVTFLLIAVFTPNVFAGSVTRSFSETTLMPGETLTVTLDVDVITLPTQPFDDAFSLVDDYPSGWILTDAGTLDDDESGLVKSVVHENAVGVSYIYDLTAPSQSGVHDFDGWYMFNGSTLETSTSGDTQVTVGFCDPGPPAETDTCGVDVGECEFGTTTCQPDYTWGTCQGGVTAVPEICDGLNNDCDGTGPTGLVDEDWPELGTSCTVGVGACENTGTMVCNAAHDDTECSVVPGTPSAESCPYNGIDDDCDGDDPPDYRGDACINNQCSGTVDISDLVLIGSHFGEVQGDAGYDDNADLVDDNEIDIFDLVTVGVSFGSVYAASPISC